MAEIKILSLVNFIFPPPVKLVLLFLRGGGVGEGERKLQKFGYLTLKIEDDEAFKCTRLILLKVRFCMSPGFTGAIQVAFGRDIRRALFEDQTGRKR